MISPNRHPVMKAGLELACGSVSVRFVTVAPGCPRIS